MKIAELNNGDISMQTTNKTYSELCFEYHCINDWPPLAWFSECSKKNNKITVWHGNGVEINPKWFCEAVWPGNFLEGDFDETDLMAGTGSRIRGNSVIFVSPGNTVDRILSLETEEKFFVSNSLACLLAISGARIDPTYPEYYEDFTTILKGILEYKKTLRTSLGDIQITMFGFVIWSELGISYAVREAVDRTFSDFNQYEQFLQSNLSRLVENMSDPNRKRKYQLLSTASSGYDSTAIAALSRKVGCEYALCIDKDRFGNSENGDQIAAYLKLNPIKIQRDAWRQLNGEELFFLAADGTAEAVPIVSAGDILTNKVLLTGYHGDKLWSKDTKDLSENIVRGDSSGLSLTEYRLWKAFIHCPMTFWGVQQIRFINEISNSEEMKPWDIPGDYSRPIPRRIAESAGIPRNTFGITKKASAVDSTEFLSAVTLQNYRSWLINNRLEWFKRGRVPPIVNQHYEQAVEKIYYFIQRMLLKMPYFWRFVPNNSLDKPSHFRKYVFAWAIDQVKDRYHSRFEQNTNDTDKSLKKAQ